MTNQSFFPFILEFSMRWELSVESSHVFYDFNVAFFPFVVFSCFASNLNSGKGLNDTAISFLRKVIGNGLRPVS